MTPLKPYKATIEIVYAASGDLEAELLLGHMRFGATGALSPNHAPETVKSETKALKQVPTETRLHDLMDRLRAEEEAKA